MAGWSAAHWSTSALPAEPIAAATATQLEFIVSAIVLVGALLVIAGIWVITGLQLRAARRAEFDLVGRVQRAERINRIAILSTLGAFLAIAVGLILWLFTSVL